MGERSLSLDLRLSASCLRCSRASLAAAIAAAAASRFAISLSSSSDSSSDDDSCCGRRRGGGGGRGRSVLRYAMSLVSPSSASFAPALSSSPELPPSDAAGSLSLLSSLLTTLDDASKSTLDSSLAPPRSLPSSHRRRPQRPLPGQGARARAQAAPEPPRGRCVAAGSRQHVARLRAASSSASSEHRACARRAPAPRARAILLARVRDKYAMAPPNR